jgi:hypothetical protein
MIGTKGLPTGIIVGLTFAGLAGLISGSAGVAVIFGVVFGGVVYGAVRHQALHGTGPRGDGGSTSDTGWDTSSSSWTPSSSSSESTPADCQDSGSDGGSESGSCDGGGDGGGGD